MSIVLNWKSVLRINSSFTYRGVYSGPRNTPDFTKSFNEEDPTWEGKKLRNVRQRVIDKEKGVEFTGLDKLIDDEARRVVSLPHMIYSNPKQYHVEGASNYAVMGKAVPHERKTYDKENNLDPDFVRPEVQDLLIRLCGKDLTKVFRKRQARYKEMPQLRLLTDEQLKEEYDAISKQADEVLAMPPVMTEREEIDDVLAMDEALDGYEHCNIIFTDISEDLRNNDRFVVVREPTGKLRKAVWEERDRMLQTYYSKPGRSITKPLLFEDLTEAFKNRLHENVLEQLVVHYEPDSSQYIDVIKKVYDDVNQNALFEILRSTRFFGGLAFHLAKHRSIDNLLVYFIENTLITEAGDLVTLFASLNASSTTASRLQANTDDLEKVQIYFSVDAEDTRSINDALEALKPLNKSESCS